MEQLMYVYENASVKNCLLFSLHLSICSGIASKSAYITNGTVNCSLIIIQFSLWFFKIYFHYIIIITTKLLLLKHCKQYIQKCFLCVVLFDYT